MHWHFKRSSETCLPACDNYGTAHALANPSDQRTVLPADWTARPSVRATWCNCLRQKATRSKELCIHGSIIDFIIQILFEHSGVSKTLFPTFLFNLWMVNLCLQLAARRFFLYLISRSNRIGFTILPNLTSQIQGKMHISTAAREMAVELERQSTPNTDETVDRSAISLLV